MRTARKTDAGFTLIELLIAVAVIAILAMIALPNLQNARRKALYSRTASDTKTAIAQTVVYQNDQGVFPGSMNNLRVSGYANVADRDPWNTAWVTTNLFQNIIAPGAQELHICSEGPSQDAPDCSSADLVFLPASGVLDGGVGYSAFYGPWQGK
jgi:prepilin-type N-terminal cleavage/methylation domain-containing protein